MTGSTSILRFTARTSIEGAGRGCQSASKAVPAGRTASAARGGGGAYEPWTGRRPRASRSWRRSGCGSSASALAPRLRRGGRGRSSAPERGGTSGRRGSIWVRGEAGGAARARRGAGEGEHLRAQVLDLVAQEVDVGRKAVDVGRRRLLAARRRTRLCRDGQAGGGAPAPRGVGGGGGGAAGAATPPRGVGRT